MRFRMILDNTINGINNSFTSLFVYLGKKLIGRLWGYGIFPAFWEYHFSGSDDSTLTNKAKSSRDAFLNL